MTSKFIKITSNEYINPKYITLVFYDGGDWYCVLTSGEVGIVENIEELEKAMGIKLEVPEEKPAEDPEDDEEEVEDEADEEEDKEDEYDWRKEYADKMKEFADKMAEFSKTFGNYGKDTDNSDGK